MEKRFVVVILILVVGISAFYLPKGPFSDEKVLFRVEKGEGSKEIAHNLQNQGLIWWGPLFRLYSLTSGVSGKLQAGTYKLSPSIDTASLVKKMSRGEVATIKLTIPEGFTAKKIQERIKALTNLEILDLKEREGYLFPDTYLVTYDANAEEIVQMILDNFYKKTAGLEITKDIITMASLIEKEVITKEDKEIVSGIFWKRIDAGLPIESCATIAYVKEVDQWRYSFEDTRIESPYNTYLNYGLPPGPISNPGLESILAAIYPQDSQYWYYLSTPEGETIFSRTLEEHNIAKAKYLK